jgi:hypothetical protein
MPVLKCAYWFRGDNLDLRGDWAGAQEWAAS